MRTCPSEAQLRRLTHKTPVVSSERRIDVHPARVRNRR